MRSEVVDGGPRSTPTDLLDDLTRDERFEKWAERYERFDNDRNWRILEA